MAPTETMLDDFNRADGYVYAGSALWSPNRLDVTGTATEAKVIGNQLGITLSTWYQAVSLFNMPSDFDLLLDCVVAPGAPNNEWSIWFCGANQGNNFSAYSIVGFGTNWQIRAFVNGASAGTLAAGSGSFVAAGDTVWINKQGTTLTVYRRPSAGSYTQMVQAVSSLNDRAGFVAIEMSDPSVRWDNLRGGDVAVGLKPFNPIPVQAAGRNL